MCLWAHGPSATFLLLPWLFFLTQFGSADGRGHFISYTGDHGYIPMLWITCKLQVLCENTSPIGLLALRKDLSRNCELCWKLNLNNQLPPRSHNAGNEIFGLHFTRHQSCSTDLARQHFFVFFSGANQAVPSVPACWTGPREVPSRGMRS